MAKQVVGFIGLGLMGRGMAGNILRKGNDLLVMAHRNRAPVDELVAAGAREVKSAREMAAAADIICICVTGSPEVEAVVRAECNPRGEARSLLASSSTADPVRPQLAKRCARRRAGTAAVAHPEGGGSRHARLHGRRIRGGFRQGKAGHRMLRR
jgi:3-hydroxyisobutyrate dehydrogenase-like beta-hydroxyacid dehydrogenase